MNTSVDRPAALAFVIAITALFGLIGTPWLGMSSLAALLSGKSILVFLFLFFGFLLSLFDLIVAIGLWRREDWSYGLAQKVYGFCIVFAVLFLYLNISAAASAVVLVLITLLVWMIVYVGRLRLET